jgi:surfactin synthase thioesterase subunit
MTTFVFIPGAGGVAWYWHRVVRLLEEAQHESVAVDLPGDVDLATYFLHDLPAETIRQGAARERPEAEIVFSEPCRFEAWPDVPIHVIAGSDDRFFPLDF